MKDNKTMAMVQLALWIFECASNDEAFTWLWMGRLFLDSGISSPVNSEFYQLVQEGLVKNHGLTSRARKYLNYSLTKKGWEYVMAEIKAYKADVAFEWLESI